MSDDKTKRGPPDSNLISLTEPWEVDYWTKELNVTEARLRQVVGIVGHLAAKVRAYLAQQKG